MNPKLNRNPNQIWKKKEKKKEEHIEGVGRKESGSEAVSVVVRVGESDDLRSWGWQWWGCSSESD